MVLIEPSKNRTIKKKKHQKRYKTVITPHQNAIIKNRRKKHYNHYKPHYFRTIISLTLLPEIKILIMNHYLTPLSIIKHLTLTVFMGAQTTRNAAPCGGRASSRPRGRRASATCCGGCPGRSEAGRLGWRSNSELK